MSFEVSCLIKSLDGSKMGLCAPITRRCYPVGCPLYRRAFKCIKMARSLDLSLYMNYRPNLVDSKTEKWTIDIQ